MSFQTPITVKEAVENIDQKRYLLPAIQREVVWGVEQIERLFDSLLRDYPIGSFLFWHVERKNAGNFQFYEFVREYHERDNSHNPKANVSGKDDVTGILDGQQRLTSLYLGLKGSYAYKELRKRWDNPHAFPKRRLYLNLVAPAKSDKGDMIYDFVFLTDDESKEPQKDTFWFRVGDILDIKSQSGVNKFLIQNKLMNRPEGQAEFANETLFKLWSVVHDAKVINYFLEKDESLDKVLNIFIRVNSGGTILSYSDLLLSIATAQWKKLDAREEITAIVDELNAIGSGFNFDKDFILKNCLVLGDFNEIAFKVDNFNKSNMLKIENEWDAVTSALRHAVTLISSFGYNRERLTSNNAVIPIAYYLLKKGIPNNYVEACKFREDREAVRLWLILSLVKRTFGGVPDTVLRPIREILRKQNGSFPLEEIKDKFKGTTKSMQVTEDDIENLLMSRYGQGYTFSTLSLLYPTLDYRNKFHIDHIYARSLITRAKLAKQGIPESDIEFYMESVDGLPNLQLLEGIPNQEKSDSLFGDWLKKTCASKPARADFCAKHFIPDCDVALENFPEFFAERKSLLKQKLAEVLQVKLHPAQLKLPETKL
jgi:uncharacterized protein with ParB-like and HNH nuclease domain